MKILIVLPAYNEEQVLEQNTIKLYNYCQGDQNHPIVPSFERRGDPELPSLDKEGVGGGWIKGMERIHNLKIYKQIRKKLRNEMTKSEVILWSRIKHSQLGYKFRRQQSIGNYIVDFYCPKLKLAVELDGATHDHEEIIEKDKQKQGYLESIGFLVKRYYAEEIFNNIDVVLENLRITCDTLSRNKNS